MLVLLNSLAYAGMPPQAPIKKTSYTKGKVPEAEVESRAVYPEQRLWTAIILMAVQDYEDQLIHIRKLWDADHRPLSRHLLHFLRVLKYEAQHDWFRHVCDLADLDQDHILNKMKEMDFKYKLSEVKFADTDHSITRYQLRKTRKRQYGS